MFYYLRNEKNEILVTICLVRNENNNLNRGLVIKSNKDKGGDISKIDCRTIAFARAVGAKHFYNRQFNDLDESKIRRLLKQTREKDLQKVVDYSYILDFKSQYNVEPTDFEEHLRN